MSVPADPGGYAEPTRSADTDAVAGALSHDVRGALRGVTGFLGLVERELEAIPADLQGYVATAHRSAVTADRMVERLVHWIRLEHRVVHPVPLEVASLVDEALQLSDDHLELAGEGPPPEVHAAGVTLLGERSLVVECLAELLTNARIFGGGEVRLVVRAGQHHGWTTVEVGDDGPGVPPDLAEEAFELFRLLQPRGRFPGVGMGLPIARRLAEVQGGSLSIADDGSDAGTTARLRLPHA